MFRGMLLPEKRDEGRACREIVVLRVELVLANLGDASDSSQREPPH